MPALTSVGEYLYANENATLQSFSAPALTSVGQYVYPSSNTALSTFAVSSIASVGALGDVGAADYTYITGNTSLCVQPALSIWQSITKGSVTITSNKSGCP